MDRGRWRALGGLATLAAAAAALSVGLAGCSSPVGGEEPDQGAALELQIQQQLPAQARKLGAGPVVVESVDCVEEGEGSFSCLARVRSIDGLGNPVTESLSIDGTCDEEKCLWRTSTV